MLITLFYILFLASLFALFFPFRPFSNRLFTLVALLFSAIMIALLWWKGGDKADHLQQQEISAHIQQDYDNVASAEGDNLIASSNSTSDSATLSETVATAIATTEATAESAASATATAVDSLTSGADNILKAVTTQVATTASRVDDDIDALNDTDFDHVTVRSGETLSIIAKRVYGDLSKYNIIFEANKPMLKSVHDIYPGQKLRIPKIAE